MTRIRGTRDFAFFMLREHRAVKLTTVTGGLHVLWLALNWRL